MLVIISGFTVLVLIITLFTRNLTFVSRNLDVHYTLQKTFISIVCNTIIEELVLKKKAENFKSTHEPDHGLVIKRQLL